MSDATGIRRGLTNYGDKDFAQYLRNSFARSMGLSREMLAKPIVGIAMTPSGFNNCHRAMPELVDAVSRGVLMQHALTGSHILLGMDVGPQAGATMGPSEQDCFRIDLRDEGLMRDGPVYRLSRV